MKPNFHEFCGVVGKSLENTDEVIETYGPVIVRKLDTQLLVSRSEHGASLVTRDGQVTHIPIHAGDVYDVTGAGDTFVAACVVALSR